MSILGQAAATRRRFAAGTYNADGIYVAGATTDLAIQATELPLTGKDLQTLTEGERARNPKKFFTTTNSRVVDLSTQTLADHILVGSEEFEARSVRNFKTIIPHFHVVALELQEVAP